MHYEYNNISGGEKNYSCRKCQAGFHRADKFNCQINVHIQNCSVYSGTTDTTTCIQCEDTYYLSSNSCAKWNIVDKCKEYASDWNLCLVCEVTFIFNEISRSCEPEILNCKVYQFE